MASSSHKVAGIQYLGRGGITRPCIDGVVQLIQFGEPIVKATLLSNLQDHDHGFLIEDHYGNLTGIKAGFGSGYSGEGPRGLSSTLELLDRHNVEIDEVEVSRDLVDRLNHSALTRKDIDDIQTTKPVRPQRWFDYVQEDHLYNKKKRNLVVSGMFPPVIPFALVHNNLVDVAIGFEEEPDGRLMNGYRRLEQNIKQMSGLSGTGSKLFSKAILSNDAPLHWPDLDSSEQTGRAQLYSSVFMAYRNHRAHNEMSSSLARDIREFLILNELFWLSDGLRLKPKGDS